MTAKKTVLAVLVVLPLLLAVPPKAEDPPEGTVICMDPSNLQLLEVNLTAEGTEVDASLGNPTTSQESGVFIAEVMMNGEYLPIGIPLDMLPGETLHIGMRFPIPINPVGFSVCAEIPGGIIEAPDPVEVEVRNENNGNGNGNDKDV